MERGPNNSWLMRHRSNVLASMSLTCAVVAASLLIHLYRSFTVTSRVATWAALRMDDGFSEYGKRSNESADEWSLLVRESNGITEILTLEDPTLMTIGYDSVLWVLDRQCHTSWLFPTRARSFVSYFSKADDRWTDRKPIPPAMREQAAALFRQEFGTRAASVFRLLVDEDQPRESVRWSGYVANATLFGSVAGAFVFGGYAVWSVRRTRHALSPGGASVIEGM